MMTLIYMLLEAALTIDEAVTDDRRFVQGHVRNKFKRR